jgi:hypothetical protein
MNINELDERTNTIKIKEKFVSLEWYRNIVSYLLTLKCRSELSPSKSRTLKLHAVKYCIAKNQLYWKYPLGFLLICLVESEIERVISEFHKGVCEGHHA